MTDIKFTIWTEFSAKSALFCKQTAHIYFQLIFLFRIPTNQEEDELRTHTVNGWTWSSQRSNFLWTRKTCLPIQEATRSTHTKQWDNIVWEGHFQRNKEKKELPQSRYIALSFSSQEQTISWAKYCISLQALIFVSGCFCMLMNPGFQDKIPTRHNLKNLL